MSDGSDSDKETLSVLCSRLHRYPVGTKVRRHFDSGWFDGEVVVIHVHDKLWTIRCTDGDEEDFKLLTCDQVNEMIGYGIEFGTLFSKFGECIFCFHTLV